MAMVEGAGMMTSENGIMVVVLLLDSAPSSQHMTKRQLRGSVAHDVDRRRLSPYLEVKERYESQKKSWSNRRRLSLLPRMEVDWQIAASSHRQLSKGAPAQHDRRHSDFHRMGKLAVPRSD